MRRILDYIIPMPRSGYTNHTGQQFSQGLELVGFCPCNKEALQSPPSGVFAPALLRPGMGCPPFGAQLHLHSPGSLSDPQMVLSPLTCSEHDSFTR